MQRAALCFWGSGAIGHNLDSNIALIRMPYGIFRHNERMSQYPSYIIYNQIVRFLSASPTHAAYTTVTGVGGSHACPLLIQSLSCKRSCPPRVCLVARAPHWPINVLYYNMAILDPEIPMLRKVNRQRISYVCVQWRQSAVHMEYRAANLCFLYSNAPFFSTFA